MRESKQFLNVVIPINAEAIKGFKLTNRETIKIYTYIFTAVVLQHETDENQRKGLQTKMDRAVRALRKNPKDKNTIEAVLRKTNALIDRDIKRQRT